MTTLLIGGYTPDKGAGSGITVVKDCKVVATVKADSPSWITRHPHLPVLYAVAELDAGMVRAWTLVNGIPNQQLGEGESGGAEPAHAVVDPSGRFLISANYTGGSISVHRLEEDGRIGQRTHLVRHDRHGEHPRQDTAHPHMIHAMEDGLLVIDLGGDAVYHYHLSDDGELQLDDITSTPAGSGPRHVLPVGDQYYVTAELSGEVLVYDKDWNFAGAVKASHSDGPNQPSELVSDGSHLYVGNRGPNTVAVFALDEPLPRYLTEVPAGDWPRHIALDDGYLYVASERSHQVLVMKIDPDTGVPALIDSVEVPSPTNVLL